ncbi:MAG TPA: NUDIX domain-containing protein [Polyangiales bacterium]|nr:NUDIX domain-containing protein [Polyangiales bacterium]
MLPHGHHVVAVAALVIQGDRVLAMRRAATNRAGPGLWETISGRIEHGEEPLAAVRREISEESGLTVDVEARPFASYAAQRRGLPMIVVAFRARYLGGEVRLSDEHDAFAWVRAEEFRARSTLAPLVAVVERSLREAW